MKDFVIIGVVVPYYTFVEIFANVNEFLNGYKHTNNDDKHTC